MKTKTKFYASKKAGLKRVKACIAEIVDILSYDSEVGWSEARALWRILSALRGPDSGESALKHITTERIRAAIGLNGDSKAGCLVNPDCKTLDYKLLEDSMVQPHFSSHYRVAVLALKDLGYAKVENDPNKGRDVE